MTPTVALALSLGLVAMLVGLLAAYVVEARVRADAQLVLEQERFRHHLGLQQAAARRLVRELAPSSAPGGARERRVAARVASVADRSYAQGVLDGATRHDEDAGLLGQGDAR